MTLKFHFSFHFTWKIRRSLHKIFICYQSPLQKQCRPLWNLQKKAFKHWIQKLIFFPHCISLYALLSIDTQGINKLVICYAGVQQFTISESIMSKKKTQQRFFSFVSSPLTVMRFSLLVVILRPQHRRNLITLITTTRPSTGEVFPSFISMLKCILFHAWAGNKLLPLKVKFV